MGGLTYYRYDSNGSFTSYSSTNFGIFSTPYDGTGTISIIQNTNNNQLLNTNYGYTGNQYIALKISGYFTPDVTGSWGFRLGYELPNDDLSYLWIGESALNPTTSNALGMTYYWSDMITVYIDLVAGQNYPILIYWGQSFGGWGISNGIIPPNGELTFDGSKYYSTANSFNYESCSYKLSSSELQCYQNNYPDLKGFTPVQLQNHWSTIGCIQDRNNQCPNYPTNIGLYTYQGCFNTSDGSTSTFKTLPNNLGTVNSINDCENLASNNSQNVFGLTLNNQGISECLTGTNINNAYKYGQNFNRNKCKVMGDTTTQQVYALSTPISPPTPPIPQLRNTDFANRIESFQNYKNHTNPNSKNFVVIIFIFIAFLFYFFHFYKVAY